jgi:hypothetical protein
MSALHGRQIPNARMLMNGKISGQTVSRIMEDDSEELCGAPKTTLHWAYCILRQLRGKSPLPAGESRAAKRACF